MNGESLQARSFLLLQGPHGPFFFSLGKILEASGCHVWRIGFNAGDRAFWPNKNNYIPYKNSHEEWAKTFTDIAHDKSITDVVLYGDIRPLHAQAIKVASELGITIHIFEEGYIRPYWITYERDGSNGNSRLINLTIDDMATQVDSANIITQSSPALWGDLRHHIFYGALYHWFILFFNQHYPNFKRHRELPISKEFLLYFKRLLTMPTHWLSRRIQTRRILHNGHPFYIALLQLEHDSSFQSHSPYETMPEFIEDVINGFARGAPKHHHLVFKAHPLENNRRNLKSIIKQLAHSHGIAERTHFVRGGKLHKILSAARAAITVNSTAGQQALHHGMPVKTTGASVYNKPELVSAQSIQDFCANPHQHEAKSYDIYRTYLLQTSQIPGGFYSIRGRKQALRRLIDRMLAENGPYEQNTTQQDVNNTAIKLQLVRQQ